MYCITQRIIEKDEITKKQRYCMCYNLFNKRYGVDVYQLTKDYNKKWDDKIIEYGGWNKKKWNAKKLTIIQYIFRELDMGSELLAITKELFPDRYKIVMDSNKTREIDYIKGVEW